MFQSKNLSQDITSYDFLKALAIILMLIDHIGYYFFPEEQWFRVLGRLCVPIWFFLIGYANSRDTGLWIWGGAIILLLANPVAGIGIFPLNILFTILAIRLILDNFMTGALKSLSAFWALNALLFLLVLPSMIATEYGTLGLMLSIFGYMMRHLDKVQKLSPKLIEFYLFFILTIFIISQLIVFPLHENHLIVMALGLIIVFSMLFLFKPKTFPELTRKMPVFLKIPFQILGRRTLEIYVMHLLLFKAAGMITDPDRFSFMQWALFTF